VTGSITERELPVSSKKLKIRSLIFTGTSTAPPVIVTGIDSCASVQLGVNSRRSSTALRGETDMMRSGWTREKRL